MSSRGGRVLEIATQLLQKGVLTFKHQLPFTAATTTKQADACSMSYRRFWDACLEKNPNIWFKDFTRKCWGVDSCYSSGNELPHSTPHTPHSTPPKMVLVCSAHSRMLFTTPLTQ